MSVIRDVQSIKLVNTSQLVSGASIDLINIGAVKGSFTCNSNYGKSSQAVDLPISATFTFEYNQWGYQDILVDATGTEIHIVIKN
jgi:hypothetical protein